MDVWEAANFLAGVFVVALILLGLVAITAIAIATIVFAVSSSRKAPPTEESPRYLRPIN